MKNAKRSSVAVSILLSTAAAVAWAQAFSVRPGEYESTVEMQLPDAPASMSHKALSCITASDARDVHRTLKKALAQQEGQCKISNEKNSAGRLDFDMVCVDDEGTRSTTRVETTFSDTAYEQVAITKMGRDVITMKTKAKWLRANCSKESMADDDEE